MDYLRLTAPCGLDCFNCHFYLASSDDAAMAEVERLSRILEVPAEQMLCKGCRDMNGCLPIHQYISARGPDEPCPAYACSQAKGVDFCCDCDEFPCDHLHPYSDRASKVPHNTKVFNLCLIKRMGLEAWAKEKAASVKEVYFTRWWTL